MAVTNHTNACSINGCTNGVLAHGWCKKHYLRWWRYGDTDTLLRERSHGHSHTKTYYVWQAMISRCHRPTDLGYKNYGARGIQVCARWRKSFTNFFEDMGHPLPGLSLDRINNNGNYEPSNCRWATKKQQANNRRQCKVSPNRARDAIGRFLPLPRT